MSIEFSPEPPEDAISPFSVRWKRGKKCGGVLRLRESLTMYCDKKSIDIRDCQNDDDLIFIDNVLAKINIILEKEYTERCNKHKKENVFFWKLVLYLFVPLAVLLMYLTIKILS